MSGRAQWTVGAAFAALALLIIAMRLVLDGRAAVARGAAAEAQGEARIAVVEYLEAARSYVPGAPHVGQALAALDAVAGRAEAAGDLDLARRALDAERAALLGTRSLYTPFAERLPGLEARLARLYARLDDGPEAPADKEAFFRTRLAARPGARVGFSLLALGGLGLLLGGVAGFVRRGLDAGLHLRARPALWSGLVFALGVGLFLLGLRLA